MPYIWEIITNTKIVSVKKIEIYLLQNRSLIDSELSTDFQNQQTPNYPVKQN